MFKYLLISLFFLSNLLGDLTNVTSPQRVFFSEEGPVLVGPLLSPSGETLPAGHIDVEPYLFVTTFTGFYNNHWHLERFPFPFETIDFLLLVQVGLNSFMDFTIIPQLLYQSYRDVDSCGFGDLFYDVGFQLIKEEDGRGIPGLRFTIGQIIPTGTYDMLRADKFGTDAIGEGSFDLILRLVTSYMWSFKYPHYLAARMAVSYLISSRVSVTGINFYGGDNSTRGKVFPGDFIQILIGIDYTLTRYFAIALDIENELRFPTRFKGRTFEPVGIDKLSYQFSLAPAIEFNYSHNLAVTAGVWFTVIGRNWDSFVSGILAINFYL